MILLQKISNTLFKFSVVGGALLIDRIRVGVLWYNSMSSFRITWSRLAICLLFLFCGFLFPSFHFPVGIYMLKVNNGHTKIVWNLLKVNKWDTRATSGIFLQNAHDNVLVSLLLTLNRFHTFFWCFHNLLWTSKSRLGYISLMYKKKTISIGRFF